VPYVSVGKENSSSIDLYYEDHGRGAPIVLIHGFLLSGNSWEKQVPALLNAGHRVITYDRRGFGGSSRPAFGYDYDSFAEDLNMLMEELDLRHTALVGFSTGTGEVARYLSSFGSERVSKAVLLAPVPPFFLKTPDNPAGVDRSFFDGIKKSIIVDRPAYIRKFLDDFFNVDVLGGERVSEQAWQMSFNIAVAASAKGTLDCVDAWLTDFRADLPRIDVPTLVVQGNEDRILPIDATGRRLAGMLPDARFVEIEGGPHNILWTHAQEVNRVLVAFVEE
jgi:non-heme chloroperoxidase